MAAPTHINALITELWLKNGKMKDNFFKGTPLLDLMYKNKISHKRGNELRQRIEVGDGNFKFYSGLDTMDREEADFASYATWNWKSAMASVVIAGDDLRRADTKADMIDLVDSTMMNTMKTGKSTFNQHMMLSTGTGAYAKSVEGFAVKFAAGATACGGLTSTDVTTWAPQLYDTEIAFATPSDLLVTTIKSKLLDTVEDLASPGSRPNVIVTTRLIYNKLYQHALAKSSLVTNLPASPNGAYLASLGWKAIELDGVPVIVDSNCPAGYMYAFNTDNLQLVVHPDANFSPVPGDDGKPMKLHKLDNQDAYAMDLVLMSQMVVAERRALSVCSNVTTS